MTHPKQFGVYFVIRAKADVASALDRAIGAMTRARRCLTPGMKAGVADACLILDRAVREANDGR